MPAVSNDIRDIADAAAKGNARAQLALDVFVASARHWIGALFSAIERRGRHGFHRRHRRKPADMRAAICRNLDNLASNWTRKRTQHAARIEAVISAPDSRVKIMVIPTNEELVVAREAKRFLEIKTIKPSRII